MNNQSKFNMNKHVRNKQNLPRKNSTTIISRITLTAKKPVEDLRKILLKKKNTKKQPESTPTPNNRDVKSRLGLQSKAAKLEALREARSQKSNSNTKPNDTKSIKKNSNFGTDKNKPNSLPNKKTEPSFKNRDERKKILDKNNMDGYKRNQFKNAIVDRESIRKNLQPIIIPQNTPTVIFQQPYDNAIRYKRRSPIQAEISSSLGNSVLVSNLNPSITEDEIAELFGDIGPLFNIQMINKSTALVTYFSVQNAIKAVKVYNYRLFDDVPLNCTIVPSTQAINQTQVPIYNTGRLYSDQMNSREIPAYHINI